jgi:hypothetical protein
MPNMLKENKNEVHVNNVPPRITALRFYYFNKLADILYDQYSKADYNGELVDSWTLVNHILNTLDHDFTSMDKLANLTALA